MEVLITGGAGYIGSLTVRSLREQGHGVVVLDSLEQGYRDAIGDAPFIKGNIADAVLLDQLFAEHNIDAVIHFAAYKAAGESVSHPARYFENNVCGTLTLLQAMVRANVHALAFSSSASVYGTPTDLPVRETSALHPESPYAESKLIVEQMLKWFDGAYGLRSASLRYFNAAGAALDGSIGEDPARTSNLIPLVMQAAVGKRPSVTVFGTDYPTPDGTAVRDYIHVLDLADAHIKALDYLRQRDRSITLNLGTGEGSSVKQVIDLTRQISGVDIPVVYADRRPGDPVAVWADTTLARTELGWQPQYDLEAIIRSSWAWHHLHPEGYGKSVE